MSQRLRVRAGTLAMLGIIAVSPPVAAEQAGLAQVVLSQPVRPRPKDCVNADMVTLKECAVADFRAADKALNAAYGEARKAAVDDKDRGMLLEAQRIWLRFRDALCDWESDGNYRGGSMSGLVALNCLSRVTTEQVKTLENAIKP